MKGIFAIPLVAVAGVLLGAVLVCGAGIFAIQKVGMQTGLVIAPFSNDTIAVTNPQLPWLPMLAAGFLGALVAYPLILGAAQRLTMRRVVLVVAFAVTVIVLSIWGLVVGPPTGAMGDLTAENGPLEPGGIATGFQGWIENGSKASAVYVVLILALGSLLVHPGRVSESRSRG